MRPATTSAPGLASAVQCDFWQSAEGWLSSRIDSFAAPSGNADNLRGTAVPDDKVIPYCGREAFANRVAKVQFVARSAKTNLQARSCSAALPVRGSSKPSQHSIKRSKTFSRAANHPRPGRILIAAGQAMGIARAVEGLDGIVPSPGPMFRLSVVVAIVGATAFLIWLARVMTEWGIGDGLLLLFAAPFVAHLPYDAAYGVEIFRTGLAPAWVPLALAALVVAAFALLIAATRTTGADNRLDIWPPLIGTFVFQWLIVFFHLDDHEPRRQRCGFSSCSQRRRGSFGSSPPGEGAPSRRTPCRSAPKFSSAAARWLCRSFSAPAVR